MEKSEKKRLMNMVKLQRKLEHIKYDDAIINCVKEDVSRIYNLNSRFIVNHYAELKKIISKSNCSEEEKSKYMKFIYEVHKILKGEEKNGYNL